MVAWRHFNFKINSCTSSKMYTRCTKHRFLASYRPLRLTLQGLFQMHFWQNQILDYFWKSDTEMCVLLSLKNILSVSRRPFSRQYSRTANLDVRSYARTDSNESPFKQLGLTPSVAHRTQQTVIKEENFMFFLVIRAATDNNLGLLCQCVTARKHARGALLRTDVSTVLTNRNRF